MGYGLLMGKFSLSQNFPPDAVNDLPTWRFVLHFAAPKWFAGRAFDKAAAALHEIEFTAVDPELIELGKSSKWASMQIEVPPDRRAQEGSLEDYESDFWKICGAMTSCGFGDIVYEAVDWEDEEE